MSSDQKIRISLDLAKILVGVGTCFSIVFYAGMLNQKVSDMERRINNLEIWKDKFASTYTYPVFKK